MAIADGDKHDDYMKFAFQLVLQQKNILLVDKCWPPVTSFCQIATATETHKAKNDHFASFVRAFYLFRAGVVAHWREAHSVVTL